MEESEELNPYQPYQKDRPGIPSLPYRNIEEEAELPRVACLCGRRLGSRYHEFRILTRNKKPEDSLEDVFKTMGLLGTCCRDFFMNTTRIVSGSWSSGAMTKKNNKFVKAEPELPRDVPRVERNYIIYDKWNPTPLGKRDVKPKRRYELGPPKAKIISISDLFDIYNALTVETFLLAELWIEANYPDMEVDDIEGKLAFFLRFGSFVTLIQPSKSKQPMIDILDEPDVETMLPEVFNSSSIESQTNTRAAFLIHIKASKVSVTALLYPQADETIILVYTEGKIIPKRTPYYVSEIINRLFDPEDIEGKGIFEIPGDRELKKLEIRFRNDNAHLPTTQTYKSMLDDSYNKFKSKKMESDERKTIIGRLEQLNNQIRLINSALISKQRVMEELEDEGFIS